MYNTDEIRKYSEMFVVFMVLDLTITLIAINFFSFREINPLMAEVSPVDMSLKKLIATFTIITIIMTKQFPIWAYKFIFVIPFLTVVWNVFVIIAEIL